MIQTPIVTKICTIFVPQLCAPPQASAPALFALQSSLLACADFQHAPRPRASCFSFRLVCCIGSIRRTPSRPPQTFRRPSWQPLPNWLAVHHLVSKPISWTIFLTPCWFLISLLTSDHELQSACGCARDDSRHEAVAGAWSVGHVGKVLRLDARHRVCYRRSLLRACFVVGAVGRRERRRPCGLDGLAADGIGKRQALRRSRLIVAGHGWRRGASIGLQLIT